MNKVTIFLSALVLLSSFSLAFEYNTISDHDEKSAIDSLYDLSWDYLQTNPDSTLIISKDLIEVSKVEGILLGQVKGFYIMGYAHYKMNHFDLAIQNYYEALDLIRNQDSEVFRKRKMMLLHNLGVVYDLAYSYDLALKYYKDAIPIAIELNLNSDLEALYFNLGDIYRKRGLYDEACQFFNKAIETNKTTEDLKNRSIFYNALGNVYNLEGNYRYAKIFYEKAIVNTLVNKTEERDRAIFYSNLGENQFKIDQYDSAKIYYHQALEISEKYNDTEKMKWIYSNIGDVHFKEKNYHEAITWYQKSIEFGNRDAIDSELQRALQNISEAYKNLGLYREAAESLSEYIDQFAMLHEKAKTLTEQNAQYKLGEVEWQLKLAEEESKTSRNKLIFLSIIMAISLLTIVGSFRKPR